jgi:enterochelin esterase family protein
MAYPEMFFYINVMSSGWFSDHEAMYREGDERLADIGQILNKTVKILPSGTNP